MDPERNVEESIWRDSDAICALADGERHLGHALNIGGRWHAFDATHMNRDSNGFRFLGTFESVASAKSSVELSSKAAEGDTIGRTGGFACLS